MPIGAPWEYDEEIPDVGPRMIASGSIGQPDPMHQLRQQNLAQDTQLDSSRFQLDQQRLGLEQQRAAMEAEQMAMQREQMKVQLAERKRAQQEALRAKAMNLKAAAQQGRHINELTSKALKQAGNMTTGLVGGALSGVKGSAQYDFKNTLDTIKGNISFDKLQQMRQMSPTGGALGQVAVQELDMLQKTIGSLDQAQSKSQVKENLMRVKSHYTNWLNIMAQAHGYKPPARPSGSSRRTPATSRIIDFNDLP